MANAFRRWLLRRRWRRILRRNKTAKARVAKKNQRRVARARRKAAFRWRRLIDPRFYLKAAMVVAGTGLAISVVIDGGIAVLRPFDAPDATCNVVQVVDGDTVSMRCSGTGIFRARLTGFDTPELFSPKCASEYRAALAAKWALRQMIWEADDLTVRFQGEDRYGRRLAQVQLDGVSLADAMVSAGHARYYDGGRRRGWCA